MKDGLQSMLEREMVRRDFLRYTALAGGAGVLAACAKAAGPSATGATHVPVGQEPGNLEVFEWAGYELKPLWKPYAAQFPNQKPHFTFLTSDDEALAKVRAGYRPDVVHPCVGYVRDWVDLGVVQPWDTSLMPSFKQLDPTKVAAGQIDGKQYFVPLDWGFSSVLYRTDKVAPADVNPPSWGLYFNENYAGKISWWDSLENFVLGGYYLGFNGYEMTSDQLDQVQQLLTSKIHIVRNLWSSETDMNQDFAEGNIWLAYAWQGDWVSMHNKGLPVTYLNPQEGRLSWICGMVLMSGTKNYYHAHAYADAWAATVSGQWLLDNYYYGHSNMKVSAAPLGKAALGLFPLNDPTALQEPHTHIDRFIPNRVEYNRRWDEVKASAGA